MFTIAMMFFQIGGGAEGPTAIDFFLRGGPMGKFVFALLVFFSVGSWSVILGKMVHFRRANRQSDRFLEAFHRSQRFSEVNAVAGKLGASPLVGIFQAGYAEIDSQIKNAQEPERGEKRGYRITSLTAALAGTE